ncbi:unnamed protein product [Parnassius apollo]|uniref:(apollo) hypothetical protein n=1 Tax=Parnassius apollo TaxID=110799 RepID=A0A8S3XUW4_PARAO|nr:unnamed protein product [Parnassius apollo]
MNKIEIVVDLVEESSAVETIALDDEPDITSDLISKENKLFNEIVNKCYDIKDSKGMKRILNKMVIPAYRQLDENYKKSQRFEAVLYKILKLIETDPFRKFTHIRELYETLKLHKVRKKVNFVTLATNITEKNHYNGHKRKTDYNMCNLRKNPKIDVIDLDDESTTVINLDKYEFDVVVIDDERNNLDEEKENKDLDTCNTSLDKTKITKALQARCKVMSNGNLNEKEVTNGVQHNDLMAEDVDSEVNEFLVPKAVEIIENECEPTDSEKVLQIEKQIAIYKEKIATLEEQEVDDDTMASPYIVSEKYKANIVALYKELCELTGTESVKRREVRLKVNDGHPSGPVRRLERFLNNNIGSDGDPPFPDFCDVVSCVVKSNQEDGLGWTRAQIMKEATSLFTQCGRELQKRRQKREWRHLMGRVKLEECNIDPAEENPELEARLQENRRIAMKNESHILETFSMMQYLPAVQSNEYVEEPNEILDRNNSSDTDTTFDSENESIDLNDNTTVESNLKAPEEDNSKTTIDGYFETPTNSTESNNLNNNEVIIKKEPTENVAQLLEGLGDNYTATIQDIEDPFLIIEISSDSSSGEE